MNAELPLHLESHLDAARVSGSELPADPPQSIEWRFDEPQRDWKATPQWNPPHGTPTLTATEAGLRVTLTDDVRVGPRMLRGAIHVDLPAWDPADWSEVLIRARADSTSSVDVIGFGFNLREGDATGSRTRPQFQFFSDEADVVRDGTIQNYLLRVDASRLRGVARQSAWRQLVLYLGSEGEPGSVEILAVSVIPHAANYAQAGHGAREEMRNRVYRNSIYTHAPSRLEYRVRIPEGARLDVGLGVLRDDAPVTFRVTTRRGGETEPVFEETYASKDAWGQRSVDLSGLAGETVDLALETESERAGTVALWGAPTVTGTGVARRSRPNVIFYVIDGGAADFMSVYGYNRRTTPNLERLAAEGALFERAYSNSSWTRPSTATFMTSLHNSVLGGFLNWNDPIPDQAVTMAERMHGAGYQTAVFTANPNAGSLSNLKRGVDQFREDWEDFSYFGGENHRESSRFLHEGFWAWREDYPAEPYWVHFQTTDVHEEFPAVAPFAGLFVGPEERAQWQAWEDSLNGKGGHGIYSAAWDSTGISRAAFFRLHQGLYDETMAHNDYQLGRLVDRLKASGEWENTLLIIGSDHSTRAAMDDMVVLLDSLPPRWGHPIFRPTISRVPLIFVWPGAIEPGQRFSHPVSMIDVLPTLLDLVGLPPAEVAQGQSLAPLLRGEGGWTPRPVIFDEFEVDRETKELRGVIEVVDGRWGASLQINPRPPEEDEDETVEVPARKDVRRRRPVPLLLYDLWNDPFCVTSVHAEHPDLVEKYAAFLEEQWRAHQSLAQLFTPSEEAVALTPEQLQTLRTLGYIR
ncbi:MAG: sulfatase family protein [Longimicrobiales bacterium]